MEAVAKHDFVASAEDELSFKKGSVLKIMKIEDESNWLSAEKDGRTGLVPANYITFIKPSWFHGKISRVKAEGILMQQQFDGAFLIRESESSPGDFSLSVRFCEGVQHFKVLRDGAGKYFLWIKKFNSLNELVACHRSESVSRSQSIFLREMAASGESEIYIAAYEFQPEEEGELYFKRGDNIQVLDREDANWWKGRNMSSGLEGLFPATYVQKKK